MTDASQAVAEEPSTGCAGVLLVWGLGLSVLVSLLQIWVTDGPEYEHTGDGRIGFVFLQRIASVPLMSVLLWVFAYHRIIR